MTNLSNALAWRLVCGVNLVGAGTRYFSGEFGGYYFELHFVDAPTLNEVTVDGQPGNDVWIDYLEALNGESLSEFNAFMHNKIQLYSGNLAVFQERLATAGLPTMTRLSQDTQGFSVGHVAFAISGRMFEIVGPASSASDLDSFQDWNATSECPEASSLPETLDFYQNLDADIGRVDDYEGEAALLLVGIQMSYHDVLTSSDTTSPSDGTVSAVSGSSKGGDNIELVYEHLSQFTGAQVTVDLESDACDVVGLTWKSMAGLKIRYVQNNVATTGNKSLAEYDDYFASDHATFANSTW